MKPKWDSAEDEFVSFFPGKGCFVFQFHDSRMANRKTGGTDRVFTTHHPSDFIVVDHGFTFYAEVKYTTDPLRFGFSRIRPTQWASAVRTVAAGGNYFFFVKSEFMKKWYRLPAELVVGPQNQVLPERKSFRWDELSYYAYKDFS